MTELRFYFGERDRDRGGDGPLEAAVMDACARRGVAAAVTLRGVEGFGARQLVRTERLLSLSEDAPLVVVAVGETGRVQALAEEIEGMAIGGLLTLTPIGTAATSAAMAAVPMGFGGGGFSSDRFSPSTGADSPEAPAAAGEPSRSGEVIKATFWGPRAGSTSPHLAAVAALHAQRAEAAMVLLGVDGILEGERRRARFVAANRGVPAITVAIGPSSAIAAALADLDAPPGLVTVEPVLGVVSSCRIETESHHSGGRSDGVERNSVRDRVSHHGSAHARSTLVTSEIAASGGHPRYLTLIHSLREEGAAGATALRGVWGFRGGREPHGDRVLALRRDVPLLVETVDTVDRAERWRTLATELLGDDDVLHAEPVDRAIAPG